MADPKKTARKALGSSSLFLKRTRLRRDPEFTWVSGGRPYAERSEGNGQPQDDGTWGLWYSPTRPLRRPRTSRRGA